jgi:LacI family transcriptional regulator
MKKVGIRDVAKRAGVATGTVSRVLNGHASVTQEVRDSVGKVIAELGYRPDPHARSMRSRVSRLIGIVIPNLSNPFFAEVVQGAEQAAALFGYNVIFMTSLDDVAKEADRLEQLAGRKVDGIILVPSDGFHATKPPRGLPLVVLDRLIKDYPGVAADHRQGARLGAEYLLKLGHRRIGIVSGPFDSVPANDRLGGYLEAVEAFNGGNEQSCSTMVVEAAFDYEGGLRAGSYLLAQARNERPTAILASSDQQAIGCMRAAYDLGIPIPAALSVVGFDGIPLSNMTTPRLTTIRQPIAAVAAAAVEMILGSREFSPDERPLLLECTLSEGETTSPPSQIPKRNGYSPVTD